MIYCGILLLILFNIIKIKFYTIVNVKLFLNFILNLNTWFMYKSKIILILISYNNYIVIHFKFKYLIYVWVKDNVNINFIQ